MNIFNNRKNAGGNIWVWLIVIVAIIIVLFLVLRGNDNGTNNENGDNNEDNGAAGITEEGEVAAVVTYDDNGFSPAEVTIELGETVRFVNESNREMWVASAMHPTHAVFSGTNLADHCPDPQNDDFDQCEGGDTFEFTFNKQGEWAYHNHLGANHFGRVTVE